MKVINSSGEYAFLMESNSIQYQIERNCDLIQVSTNWAKAWNDKQTKRKKIFCEFLLIVLARWESFLTRKVMGSPSHLAPFTGSQYLVPSSSCRLNSWIWEFKISIESSIRRPGDCMF